MRESTPGLHASESSTDSAIDVVPRHVAIIMDGNGRWARQRGWTRSEGHRAGYSNIRPVIEAISRHGVKYLTLFAFSTENWDRPRDEVHILMELLGKAITEQTISLHNEGVRIKHLGRSDRLTPQLQKALRDSVELTKDNTELTVSVAFDYGGRAEIIDAIKRIVDDGVSSEEITEDLFRRYLYTGEVPDPDLIIRTGGEMRLSNFLLWQSFYAEYYATPVLWPAFNEDEVAQAVDDYSRRQRRFGRVGPPGPT